MSYVEWLTICDDIVMCKYSRKSYYVSHCQLSLLRNIFFYQCMVNKDEYNSGAH